MRSSNSRLQWTSSYQPIPAPMRENSRSGPLNQVIHIWGYRDAGDREAKRAAMKADPAWQDYVKKVRPLIVRQKCKLLVPAPFFEVELK